MTGTVTRRTAIQGAVAAVMASTVARAIPPRLGFGGGGLTGFLPTGHYLPRIQSLVVVHPRPDTETSANARHRFAFYDGTHPMLYDVPIDVIGGSFPHIPVITSGPPGMVVVLPNYALGPPYASPRLQWTPTGTWSGTVTIRWYSQEYQTDPTQYIDQSFSLATSSDIAHGGVFIFANKDSGLSGNSGAYSSPIDDLPTACGATAAAAPTIGGVTTGGKILVLMSSTAEYTLPLYTNGSGNSYLPNVTTKPIAYIGFPGSTQPKFSAAIAYGGASQATIVVGLSTSVSDIFFSNLNPDGYNTTSGTGGSYNTRLFSVGGSGVNRATFDSITWTNSGWGGQSGGGADNSTILETVGVSGLRQYIYCNNCSEPSRQSGNPGNNFAGPDYYAVQYGLIQGYTCNNPSFTGDSGCFLKVDCENCEVRGSFYNTSNVLYPCSIGESVLIGYTTCDITYNLLIGCNNPKNPGLNSGTAGVQTTCRVGRCSVLSPTGAGILAGTTSAGAGPFMVDSNVAQGSNVVLPTAGTDGVTTDGLNIFSTATGVLDLTTGLLTSTYKTAHPSAYGTVGAEIA